MTNREMTDIYRARYNREFRGDKKKRNMFFGLYLMYLSRWMDDED